MQTHRRGGRCLIPDDDDDDDKEILLGKGFGDKTLSARQTTISTLPPFLRGGIDERAVGAEIRH